MIELNSNTAQQDIRRVDYYSGNQDKYEKNTQSIQVRNENTGNLVKEKEIFALKEGQEEEPLENVYQSLEFDKNNEDIESRQREIHFRSNKSSKQYFTIHIHRLDETTRRS